MKIAAAVISALLTLLQGVIWVLFALIALNGFSNKADVALFAFGGLALVVTIASGLIGGKIAAGLLQRKPELKSWVVLIAVVLTSVLAALVLFVGLLATVGIASAMHGE